MPTTQTLAHYVRHHRKQAGLSQDEVGWLLGVNDGTTVSRLEHFERVPTLRTAFAYEVIFGVSASEIFAGLFEATRRATLARAATILERRAQPPRCVNRTGRRAWLERMTDLTQQPPQHERQ